MKMHPNLLIGDALDWAVAKAKDMVMGVPAYGRGAIRFKTGIWTQPEVGGGQTPYCLYSEYVYWQRKCDGDALGDIQVWRPSNKWAQGGPLIESEGIWTRTTDEGEDDPSCKWRAELPYQAVEVGPTLLIAACRCYVASKLGDEVEVPDGLARCVRVAPPT